MKPGWLLPTLILVQWLLAVRLPIVADEAYYASWATAPALGYFDHPPMIAWLLAIAPIRLVSAVCFLAGAGFMYGASKRISSHSAHWTLILLIGCPLGLVGGVIATPDGPLFFFWGMILFGVESRRSWLLGVGVAGCILSKASVLIALPGLWWYVGRNQRIAIICGILLCIPHLIWSADHGWAPYAFQARRNFTGFHTFEFLGGQIALAGPTLIFLAVAGLRGRPSDRKRACLLLVWPTLIAFLGLSLLIRVEGNWPLLAWASMAVYGPSYLRQTLKRVCVVFACLTCIVGASLALLVGFVPVRYGPDRASEVFLSCLQSVEGRPMVGLRYQDVALVRHAGQAISYFRPAGRRKSQYDTMEVPISPCGKVAVGPPALRNHICTDDSNRGLCREILAHCECFDK